MALDPKTGQTPLLQKFSYRALQAFAVLSATIAIAGGGTFVLLGIDAVPVVVGTEYPHFVTELEKSVQQISETAPVTFDTWYRLLGWYWVSAGLMLLWITPSIRTSTAWFRFIHVAFMAAGIANALTIYNSGVNIHARYDAVAIELLVPILAIVWQWRVSRYFLKGSALDVWHHEVEGPIGFARVEQRKNVWVGKSCCDLDLS